MYSSIKKNFKKSFNPLKTSYSINSITYFLNVSVNQCDYYSIKIFSGKCKPLMKANAIFYVFIIFNLFNISCSFPTVQDNNINSKLIEIKSSNRNNRDTKVINFQQPTPSPTNSQSYSNLELNKFVKNIIHSFDEDSDQQLNIAELKKMLTNRALLKKFEKIINKKHRIVIQQQTVVSSSETSTESSIFMDLKNRKNTNLRSNKKMRLQEEFRKEELNYFLKSVENEALKEMSSANNTNSMENAIEPNEKLTTRILEPKQFNKIKLDTVSKIIMSNLENSLNEKPASNSQIDVEPNNNYSTSSKLLTSLININ